MKKYIMFICFLGLMLFPMHVNARCDMSTLAEQRELAGNINTLIEYRMVDNKPVFDITFTNVPTGSRVRNLSTREEHLGRRISAGASEVALKDFAPGQTLRFEVLGNGSCSLSVLLPIGITLRPFNPFSVDPICEEAREFNMCSRWEPVAVSYDVFIERVEDFIKRRDERLEREALRAQSLSTWEQVLTFIGNYYMFIVAVVIVIVIIIAILQKIALKKSQFDFKV